jgi:hypothetical protein
LSIPSGLFGPTEYTPLDTMRQTVFGDDPVCLVADIPHRVR